MIFYFKKEPWLQVDDHEVRQSFGNFVLPSEILPEHLSESNYCLVKDCPTPEGECVETFEMDSDGFYQRVLTVIDPE